MTRRVWMAMAIGGAVVISGSAIYASGASAPAPWFGGALQVFSQSVVVRSPWTVGGLGVAGALCLGRAARMMWHGARLWPLERQKELEGRCASVNKLLWDLRTFISERTDLFNENGALRSIEVLTLDTNKPVDQQLIKWLEHIFANRPDDWMRADLRKHHTAFKFGDKRENAWKPQRLGRRWELTREQFAMLYSCYGSGANEGVDATQLVDGRWGRGWQKMNTEIETLKREAAAIRPKLLWSLGIGSVCTLASLALCAGRVCGSQA